MSVKAFCHIYGQLGQTGDNLAKELGHLLDLGLVCDTDFEFGKAERQRPFLLAVQQRGGLLAPNLYPARLDPQCDDPNWWKYSEAECLRLLRIAQERYAALNLGPMLAVNTYTPGNHFVAACRQLGIKYLLGFCAPTVIEDGGWSISHYGSPLSPYFIAADDYRKPEAPGDRPDPVLMVSMELRNPLTCLYHWSEGPWCPLNAQAVDRWLEPSGEPLPFIQIAEDWLRQTELTGEPRFFTINLQYFFAGRCAEHNRRALEWLAEQRDKGRLEIGGVRAWEERMRAGGGFVRQTTYWRGEMMGFHVGHRPGSVADVIVDEALSAQAVYEFPHATPRRRYDYRRHWQYPAFEPRGSAPASDDPDGLAVHAELLADTAPERRLAVHLDNPGPARRVAVAVWSALDHCRWPLTVAAGAGWQAQAVPHPEGIGGAVLLEGECPAGATVVPLTVRCQERMPPRQRRTWGHLLAAQTFVQRHQPYTYLVAQTPEPFAVTVRSRTPRVRVESLCGIDYEQRELPAGGLPLAFDGTRLACWHRLWGVSADELEITGVEEVEARLRRATAATVARLAPDLPVSAPGYQLFGNIRDRKRWDRTLGRAAGEAELAAMTEWFHRQRPRAGRVVLEAHPGLFLPRGSITKVLGHEFDLVKCAEGYGFQELAADYPQGWDWGVAAWVMWRHLRVRINGLRPGGGPYWLHLHGFDPEARNFAQRLHFFEPVPEHKQRPDLCAMPGWDLPQGLAGRWEPGALCSVPIPEECLHWAGLGVWICPLAKLKLYDWVAERGASGVFSHLWVTTTEKQA